MRLFIFVYRIYNANKPVNIIIIMIMSKVSYFGIALTTFKTTKLMSKILITSLT